MRIELREDGFSVLIPRVSVVMVTYNYGQYIAQAIQSVNDQTYSDWELVVVDDGSTDSTFQVVHGFSTDQRIRYYYQENHGPSHARNSAIRFSRGSLIAFLDADDAWLPEKLAKQVALFERDPELGVAYTGRRYMDEHGHLGAQEDRAMIRGDVLHVAVKRTVPSFSSSMVRRGVFDDVGLFDESLHLAVDYELWLRVALKYRFDFVDEPLLLYRTGHANLSRRSRERRSIVLNQILPRFFAKDGVRERLGSSLIAEAYASIYIKEARELRSISFVEALTWHLRALRLSPGLWEAWSSAVRCCVPDFAVRGIKAVAKQLRTANLYG